MASVDLHHLSLLSIIIVIIIVDTCTTCHYHYHCHHHYHYHCLYLYHLLSSSLERTVKEPPGTVPMSAVDPSEVTLSSSSLSSSLSLSYPVQQLVILVPVLGNNESSGEFLIDRVGGVSKVLDVKLSPGLVEGSHVSGKQVRCGVHRCLIVWLQEDSQIVRQNKVGDESSKDSPDQVNTIA